jgi:hypothetical protein
MSTTKYRIEERVTQPDGAVTVAFADEYDDRGEALGYYAYLAHSARLAAPARTDDEPDTDDFRPGSRRRLVLLGRDRTVLPRTVTEGPAL